MKIPRPALAVILGSFLLAVIVLRERRDPNELSLPPLPRKAAAAPGQPAAREPEPEASLAGSRPGAASPEEPPSSDSRLESRPGGQKIPLARLHRLFSDPAATTPDATLEIGEGIIAVNQVILHRSDDPTAYSELLRSIVEVSLAEPPLGLQRDQSERLSAVLRDAESGFARIANLPPCERLRAGLRAEADVLKATRECLGASQWEALTRSPLLALWTAPQTASDMIPTGGASESLASSWTQGYDLDPDQQIVASEAADEFVRALSALREPAEGMISLEGYAVRISALDAQAAALGRVASALTPGQRERLRATPLQEIQLLDDGTPPAPPR